MGQLLPCTWCEGEVRGNKKASGLTNTGFSASAGFRVSKAKGVKYEGHMHRRQESPENYAKIRPGLCHSKKGPKSDVTGEGTYGTLTVHIGSRGVKNSKGLTVSLLSILAQTANRQQGTYGTLTVSIGSRTSRKRSQHRPGDQDPSSSHCPQILWGPGDPPGSIR